MYIVTGGFGFIGSNIVKALNARGIVDILVVDDLTDGHKFKNLVDCQYSEYVDFEDFINSDELMDFQKNEYKGVFHEGAISSTTEWDGKKMMKQNYEYTMKLFHKTLMGHVPFSYASSASVYGSSTNFDDSGMGKPLNMYGYTKLLADQKIANFMNQDWFQKSPYIVQGWRYFNVYGRNEDHKGDQASPVHKFTKQAKETGVIKLFEGSENFKRDFVCVEDVAQVKVDFMFKPVRGIFNLGTGKTTSFREVADLVAQKYGARVEEIPFPKHLSGHYQKYTCANLDKLREAGCGEYFRTVEQYLSQQ
jgi:ADP-L-glycero-D-manno-heptose 6-epimerase